MPNWNEKEETGVKREWDRSDEFVGRNTYGQVPSIEFKMQRVVTFNDELLSAVPLPYTLKTSLANPDRTLPLIHPDLGPIGQEVSHGFVQLVLYSLCEQLKADKVELDKKLIVIGRPNA